MSSAMKSIERGKLLYQQWLLGTHFTSILECKQDLNKLEKKIEDNESGKQ